MDKQELGPILAKVYIAIRQNLEISLELTVSARATILALQECVPGFQEAYARHYQATQTGELGRSNAQAIQQFDQAAALIRTGHF
jgi:predicted outer membrane protein